MKVLKLPTIREQVALQALTEPSMAKHVHQKIKESEVDDRLKLANSSSTSLILRTLETKGYVSRLKQRTPGPGFYYKYQITLRGLKILKFIEQEGKQA